MYTVIARAESTTVFARQEQSVVMANKRWPDIAEGATRSLGVNWSSFVRDRGVGVTVTNCTYESDPPGLTLVSGGVASNVSMVSITAPAGVAFSGLSGGNEREFLVKHTLTLSNGEVESQSVPIRVVRHKLV